MSKVGNSKSLDEAQGLEGDGGKDGEAKGGRLWGSSGSVSPGEELSGLHPTSMKAQLCHTQRWMRGGHSHKAISLAAKPRLEQVSNHEAPADSRPTGHLSQLHQERKRKLFREHNSKLGERYCEPLNSLPLTLITHALWVN